MSEPAGAGVRGFGAGGLAIGATFALLALLWWLGAGERDLNRSATGFAGLVAWLEDGGIDARTFEGRGHLLSGTVGLRVLPLHDTDLARDRDVPETREQFVMQTSERDMTQYVLGAKTRLLPTLVILPKWRSGVGALAAAHRELLIPGGELNRLIGQIPGLDGTIRQDPTGYVETLAPRQSRPIGLHHPQTLRDSSCEPLVGTAGAMLLGRCALPGTPGGEAAAAGAMWILADPDLASNHGLTRAGNAALVRDLLRELAGGQAIVIDLTDQVLTLDAAPPVTAEAGEWARFARLFAWPFATVWLAMAAVAALVLWRSLTRFGPAIRLYDDVPRAAKEVSVDAKARLLRLARHDRALLAIHIRHRLQQIASELAGPKAAVGDDPLAVLTRVVGRRAPHLAAALAEASVLPDHHRGAPATLLRCLDRFETCLTRIRDEFGRAADARG